MTEVAPMALDPAMGPTHLPSVGCNTSIMPPYAATLNASPAFPAGVGGRGGVLISCMGNMAITRAVQADLIATPPVMDEGQQGQAGQQPATEYPGFVRQPDGSYLPIQPGE